MAQGKAIEGETTNNTAEVTTGVRRQENERWVPKNTIPGSREIQTNKTIPNIQIPNPMAILKKPPDGISPKTKHELLKQNIF